MPSVAVFVQTDWSNSRWRFKPAERPGCAGTIPHPRAPTEGDLVSEASAAPKKSAFLDRIERIGNALPDPMSLFAIGAALVFVVSFVAHQAGWRAQLHGSDGTLLFDETAVNLLSATGFRWLAENLIKIFVEFRPLGLVLAAAIGISVADRSGLISAGLKAILLVVPSRLLTPATVFAGVMSSLAVDAGYIVLPPLAAAVYKAVGRSPLVGIAAVFAGVGSGFSANLLVTGLDPMLAGMTEAAARILDPQYSVNAACNWWFMIASTILITFVGWGVTAWYVEPRVNLKPPEEGGPGDEGEIATMELSRAEKRGLKWATLAGLATFALIVANVVSPRGFLHDPPGTLQATWVSAMVPLLIVLFFVPGLAYGLAVKSIRSDRDVVKMMSEYMAMLGNYVVLAFFAAIFVKAFEQSNLGRMLALAGGKALARFDVGPIPLLLAFMALVMSINVLVVSMSAKWAMLSTVFVPMFMTLGVSPELTQVSYRVGDSVTNPISPLNPYMAVLLVFMGQHVKKGGLGTLIATMIPYAVALAITWSLVLVVWVWLGIPLGIQGRLHFGL